MHKKIKKKVSQCQMPARQCLCWSASNRAEPRAVDNQCCLLLCTGAERTRSPWQQERQPVASFKQNDRMCDMYMHMRLCLLQCMCEPILMNEWVGC